MVEREGARTSVITVRLPPGEAEWFTDFCEKSGVSKSSMVYGFIKGLRSGLNIPNTKTAQNVFGLEQSIDKLHNRLDMTRGQNITSTQHEDWVRYVIPKEHQEKVLQELHRILGGGGW